MWASNALLLITASRKCKAAFALTVLFSFIITLTSCVKMNDPEVSQDDTSSFIGIVDQDHIVGQSFKIRRERFSSISIWVTYAPDQAKDSDLGRLVIKFFSTINGSEPFHSTSLSILPSWQNSQLTFDIPQQSETSSENFYITVESTGGKVQIHGRSEDVYPDGSAYSDGTILEGDIAFRTSYVYDDKSVIQDLSYGFSNVGVVLPLALTVLFPGWVLLDLTKVRHRYSLGEQVALAVSLSLAIIPLLILWSTFFHIKWAKPAILGFIGFIVGYYIFRFVIKIIPSKKRSPLLSEIKVTLVQSVRLRDFLIHVALLSIIFGVIFIRLAMVRDLATPAWVDSVHHGILTRLIIENGSYPDSYLPYMDFDIYNYHVGFHGGLAFFTILSGLDIPDAMLVYGQVLNALVALSVYLLTTTYTGKPLAGLFAALITGFLTPMPAYYTSWGRYTQLTGLIILPAIIALLHPILPKIYAGEIVKKVDVRFLFLIMVGFGGLFLIHYRVFAFAILLVIAEILVYFPYTNANNFTSAKRLFIYVSICTVGIFVLVSPWIIPALSQIFLPKLSPPKTTQAVLLQDFSWRFLTTAYGKQTIVLFSLGMVWVIIKKIRLALTMIIWIALLLFMANLEALRLPGGGFITGTSVVIMLFIPISLAGGYFLGELTARWNRLFLPVHKPFRVLFWIVIISAVSWIAALGAQQLIPILNPITTLSRSADREAMKWISQNIPADSSFMINPFSWGFGLYAGNDGGYWISPITGNLTLPPPALYGLGTEDTINRINNSTQISIDPQTSPQQLSELMVANQLDYIYLGKRGGPLSSTKLLQSGIFETVYSSDGVWILHLASPR